MNENELNETKRADELASWTRRINNNKNEAIPAINQSRSINQLIKSN